MKYAPTRPATPALMCTTVPPAKSITPRCARKPPSPLHTMCTIGRYAKVTHSSENSSTAENLMRSANEPTIRAVVMPANVAWKITNRNSGRPSASVSAVMPRRKAFSVNEPKNALPSVKAAL